MTHHEEPDALDRIETLAFITAATVQRMEKQLDGNGQPGLVVRVSRIEGTLKTHKKAAAVLTAALGLLGTLVPLFLS